MTKNASFSFPDEIYPKWQTFIQLCKREGTTASRRLTHYIIQYVGEHDPGNPQTTMPSYAPEGHITISQIVGRIRQQSLEYSRKRNNEIRMKIIEEFVRDSNIKPRERLNVSDGIVSWLKKQNVSVWK